MAGLHVRDMKSPVRELIEEFIEETVTEPGEAVYERDNGLLIRVGQTPDRVVTRPVFTGKLVERFTTGDPPIVHEGSMKSQELTCGDCGNSLIGGGGQSFYFMQCSRIDPHDPTRVAVMRDIPTGDGKTTSALIYEKQPNAPKLYADCVIECGGVV